MCTCPCAGSALKDEAWINGMTRVEAKYHRAWAGTRRLVGFGPEACFETGDESHPSLVLAAEHDAWAKRAADRVCAAHSLTLGVLGVVT